MKLREFFKTERFKYNIDKNISTGIEYTRKMHLTFTECEATRFHTNVRNEKWRSEYLNFLQNNERTAANGKLNNSFYKTKALYDVVVPENIYLQIFEVYFKLQQERNDDELAFMEKYMDHIMTFCHTLYYYAPIYKTYIRSKKGRTPIYVKNLYGVLGRGYNKILSFLELNGIIEIDKKYMPGYLDTRADTDRQGFCRHYSFIEKPCDDVVVYQVLNRSIATKAYENDIQLEDNFDYSKKPKNLTLDPEMTTYFSRHFDLDKSADDFKELDYNGYAKYKRMCSSTTNKFYGLRIGRDKFGNRLYHPFLYMNKKLRKFITIENEMNNVEIDIKSSHPYLFSLLFEENFLQYASDILYEDEMNVFRSVMFDERYTESLEMFKTMASSGNYYGLLGKELGKDKDALKKTNMCYFYGRFNKNNIIYKYFNKNYPFINIVKFQISKIGGYKRLCEILTKIEAKIMIDDVFMGMKDNNYKVIPLHDAIMCRPEYVDEVKRRITNVFDTIAVQYLPKFDDTEDFIAIDTINEMKRKSVGLFMNKCIMYEELNTIIKFIGINNRVFKEDMKQTSMDYIDTRFEIMRHNVDDTVAEIYYSLRTRMESKDFDIFDYSDFWEKYKDCPMTKRVYVGKGIYYIAKVNPIEYFNYLNKTNFKTRVKEKNYMY